MHGGHDKENDPSPAKRQKTRRSQSLVDADLLGQELREYHSYMKELEKRIAQNQEEIHAMLQDIKALIQK